MKLCVEIEPEQAWRTQTAGDPLVAGLMREIANWLPSYHYPENVAVEVKTPAGMPFAWWEITDAKGL